MSKLFTHVPLLWSDLKSVDIHHEERKKQKTRDIAKENTPTDQHEQETNVHWVSAYSIDSVSDEAR